jgi:hypothetical protein
MTVLLSPGHGRKALLTMILGALLVGTLLNQKVLPAWEIWQRAQRSTQKDPFAERSRLEDELHRLNARFAAGGAGWEPVITHLSSGMGGLGITLVAVDPEHVQPLSGLHQHILPVRLAGSTAALLNTVATIDPSVHGAEVVSLDLNAESTGYQGPRLLTATLYLRCLRP